MIPSTKRGDMKLRAGWPGFMLLATCLLPASALSAEPLSIAPATAVIGTAVPPGSTDTSDAKSVARPQSADFLHESPSHQARLVADWALSSGDNGGLPYVVIDKVGARVFVFDAQGLLRGGSTALLGFAKGDDTAPGIGDAKLSAIRPDQRTTPAGRFVAALGHDLKRDVLWVDYDAAISLHRVVTGNPGDRRLQRLATSSPAQKRITYGCINVPAAFFDDVVLKAFTGTSGIVYILPEVRKLEEVFPLPRSGTQAHPAIPATSVQPANGK